MSQAFLNFNYFSMYFLKKFFLKTKGTQDKDIKIAWSKKLPVDRTKIR